MVAPLPYPGSHGRGRLVIGVDASTGAPVYEGLSTASNLQARMRAGLVAPSERDLSSAPEGPLADAVRAKDTKALAKALSDPRLVEGQRVEAALLALSSSSFKASSAIAKTITGRHEAGILLLAAATAGDAESCSRLAELSLEHPSKALSEAVVHGRSAAVAALAPHSDLSGRGLPVLRALLADSDPKIAAAIPGAAGLVPESDLRAFEAKRSASVGFGPDSAASKLRGLRQDLDHDAYETKPRP